MSGHQPKQLTALAFASFTAYIKDKVLQLLDWTDISPTSIDEASKTCKEVRDFFHGTRLPPVLANEITKRLLTKLDFFSEIYEYTSEDYFQQILMPLVEVFLHPDVTSIELGPSYLHKCDNVYCNFILSVILMSVGRLRNLKTLSVDTYLRGVKLVLPSQLEKLILCGTLFFDSDNLNRIVECCGELKSFKIMGLNNADISVPHLVKLNHLETLHLLGKAECWFMTGLDAACVALINGLSADTTSDVLSASTLKSFGVRIIYENTLRLIVDKLPHLTEIVLELWAEFDLSCLIQLKNLQSLTLEARYRESNTGNYKKILPVLGKNLVSLDLRCYKSLDLKFIGETCSNLRCLHVNTTSLLPVARTKKTLKSLPNLRTVECLRIHIHQSCGWVEFFIAQCVNIRILSVLFGRRPTLSVHNTFQPTFIENVLKRTVSLKSLEEIHWYPEERIDKSCLDELCLRCPNLRLVHGLGSDSFISGRVFDFHGCHKNGCASYPLDSLDSKNCCTSDSEST